MRCCCVRGAARRGARGARGAHRVKRSRTSEGASVKRDRLAPPASVSSAASNHEPLSMPLKAAVPAAGNQITKPAMPALGRSFACRSTLRLSIDFLFARRASVGARLAVFCACCGVVFCRLQMDAHPRGWRAVARSGARTDGRERPLEHRDNCAVRQGAFARSRPLHVAVRELPTRRLLARRHAESGHWRRRIARSNVARILAVFRHLGETSGTFRRFARSRRDSPRA